MVIAFNISQTSPAECILGTSSLSVQVELLMSITAVTEFIGDEMTYGEAESEMVNDEGAISFDGRSFMSLRDNID